jgi:hypothetical protein
MRSAGTLVSRSESASHRATSDEPIRPLSGGRVLGRERLPRPRASSASCMMVFSNMFSVKTNFRCQRLVGRRAGSAPYCKRAWEFRARRLIWLRRDSATGIARFRRNIPCTNGNRRKHSGPNGLRISETNHDPFTIAAMAMIHTTRLTVRTNMALTFPRSPTIAASLPLGQSRYRVVAITSICAANSDHAVRPFAALTGA